MLISPLSAVAAVNVDEQYKYNHLHSDVFQQNELAGAGRTINLTKCYFPASGSGHWLMINRLFSTLVPLTAVDRHHSNLVKPQTSDT